MGVSDMDCIGVHGIDDEGRGHYGLIGGSVTEVDRFQDRYRWTSLLRDLSISGVGYPSDYTHIIVDPYWSRHFGI